MLCGLCFDRSIFSIRAGHSMHSTYLCGEFSVAKFAYIYTVALFDSFVGVMALPLSTVYAFVGPPPSPMT